MQFSVSTLLLLAVSMVDSGLATPLASAQELSVERSAGGSIVTYGPDARSLTTRASCGGFFQPACEKRCVQNDINSPKCDDKNGGSNETCDELMTNLYGNMDQALNEDARQICFKNDEGATKCCVKWTKKVPGLTKGDLKNYAEKIVSACDTNGVSGKYNSVELRGVCSSFCMSVGAGCKDESKTEDVPA